MRAAGEDRLGRRVAEDSVVRHLEEKAEIASHDRGCGAGSSELAAIAGIARGGGGDHAIVEVGQVRLDPSVGSGTNAASPVPDIVIHGQGALMPDPAHRNDV